MTKASSHEVRASSFTDLYSSMGVFLVNPMIRTYLLSGIGVNTFLPYVESIGKASGRNVFILHSQASILELIEPLDLESSLQCGRAVKGQNRFDDVHIVLIDGIERMDISTWQALQREQARRYNMGKPLQILALSSDEGASAWAEHMDMWVTIEELTFQERISLLEEAYSQMHRLVDHDELWERNRCDSIDVHESMVLDELHTMDGGAVREYLQNGLHSSRKVLSMHRSLYEYIVMIVNEWHIDFQGMEYILAQVAKGLATVRHHSFVQPNDIDDILLWTVPQKLKENRHSSPQGGNEISSSDEAMTDSSQGDDKEEEVENPSDLKDSKNSHKTSSAASNRNSLPRDETHESKRDEERISHNREMPEQESSTKDETNNDSGGNAWDELSYALDEDILRKVQIKSSLLSSMTVQRHTNRCQSNGIGQVIQKIVREGHRISWVHTILHALVRGKTSVSLGKEKSLLPLQQEDIQYYQHKPKKEKTIYFLLDASGSMGARKRLAETKEILSALLQESYVQRHAVSLIVFQRDGARCVLNRTKQVTLLQEALGQVKVGGKTPLLEGLEEGIMQIARQQEVSSSIVVLMTDGKIQDNLTSAKTMRRLEDIAYFFQKNHIESIVINTEQAFIPLGKAKEIAHHLGATYKEYKQGCIL